MAMVFARLHFVIVLLALDVHQVQLIDQSLVLQQRNGAVNCRSIDIRFTLSCQAQQFRRIKMTRNFLNNFNDRPSLEVMRTPRARSSFRRDRR